MRLRSLVAAVAVGVLAPLALPPAVAREASSEFVVGSGLGVRCSHVGFDGACFPVADGDAEAQVTVADGAGVAVAATVTFESAAGLRVGPASAICGESPILAIPTLRPLTLVVDVSTPVAGCLSATASGTVSVEFR